MSHLFNKIKKFEFIFTRFDCDTPDPFVYISSITAFM